MGVSNEEIRLLIQTIADKAIADLNKYNKSLKDTGQITDKTNKKSKNLAKTQKSMMSSYLKGAFGLAAFVTTMKKAISAASSLEETTSKFNTVFGKQQKVAEATAKVLVNSYAMSTREAKSYLASVQDLLVPMGMNADAAANMSGEVVKLSADLASMNDMPTKQVMDAMQSALVGNFETMKSYGVILNETVVKQEAMNAGLWNGKGRIDAVAKSQAAWNIILRSSEKSQGDMIRTSNSFANVVKRMGAAMEDSLADLGKEMLPALKDLALAFLETTKSGGVFSSYFCNDSIYDFTNKWSPTFRYSIF
jgi:hypothetical protein